MFTTEEVTRAYEHCRRVTALHARTFYFASFFLGGTKRRACYAVYAFCRYIDDLVDDAAGAGPVDAAAVERTIRRWQGDLDAVYAGEDIGQPVMIAWADVLRHYHIPRELPDELVAGCMSDLREAVRYDTFEDLYGYCYKVASVVGLMTSRIFGYTDPTASERAIELGVAMQLTNILRDVGEDLSNNRIYLPADELSSFGIGENDLLERRVTPKFREMMRFQIARARKYYADAEPGIRLLDSDSRLTVRLMGHNYSRILDAIERNGYDVFSHRASVPFRRKMTSIPALWFESVTVG